MLAAFKGGTVRCEKIEVTIGSDGTLLRVDFADPVLSMSRADDRASWRQQVRNSLRLTSRVERSLDDGNA